jgi:hypothetical protein
MSPLSGEFVDYICWGVSNKGEKLVGYKHVCKYQNHK